MRKLLAIIFFFPISIQAQTFAERLQERLNTFYKNNLPLKIHLVTDQQDYLHGDTIFFKIHLLAAQGLRPIAGRSIVTVSLTDNQNRDVVTQQISVRDGADHNQVIIPQNLVDGEYFLVAYNDWMKNSSEKLFFRRSIAIGGDRQKEIPVAGLSVFPEGGPLVNGLTSRLVVKGNPGSSVRLLDTNRTLSDVKLNDLGYGMVFLTPSADGQYKFVSDGVETIVPQALMEGAVMSVMPVQNATLRTSIQLSEQSMLRDKMMHIVMSVQGEIVYAADFSFRKQKLVTISIPIESVPPGIAQLTLFSDEGKVLCDRMVFVPPSPVNAKLNLEKDTYGTREKLAADISTRNIEGKPVKARMTASVFKLDESVGAYVTDDILTSLYLKGDIGNDYPIPTTADPQKIDMSLVASEWLRFSWDDLEKTDNKHNFNQNIRFAGTAVYEKSGLPVPDSTLISLFLQNTVVVYQVYTNREGQFDMFMLFDFFDADEVFYRVEYKGLSLDSVKILPARNLIPSAGSLTVLPVKSSQVFDRRAIERSYSFYSGERSDYRTIVDRRTTFAQEYRDVDLSIKLSDYLLFPDMSETLHEVIPLVKHRKSRGKDIIRIYNDESDIFPNEDPIFVIDGVMTDNVSYFLNLNPKQVETISVIYSGKKIDMFGPIGRAGIIVVETKLPNNNVNVPRSKNSLTIPGLSRRLQYSVKTHGPSDARIPDLRTNLTWKSELISNDEGNVRHEFFTSDVPGEYVIVIEGITSDGDPFFVSRSFTVKFRPSAN